MSHQAAAFACFLMTFFALLVALSTSMEYVTSAVDCNSTSYAVTYNISTLMKCLTQCMMAGCFYVKYEGQTCQMNGTDPRPSPNSHMMWKTFRAVASLEQNIADQDKTSSQSSTYLSDTPSNASMDGSLSTRSATTTELDPWWKVDLLKRYYVTKLHIRIRSTWTSRFTSVTFYLSDEDATPAQFSQLQVFTSQLAEPTTADFNLTGDHLGMCGRFLFVARAINPGILEIVEIGIYVLDNVQCV